MKVNLSDAEQWVTPQYIFDLIGNHSELADILNAISGFIETRFTDAIVSVMAFDETANTLSLIAGERLSPGVYHALQNVSVGPNVGTCGSAASSRQVTITEDIHKDPRWEGFRDIADIDQLRACWSVPILNVKNKLYGTLGTYYREPRTPRTEEIDFIQRLAALIALAWDHQLEIQQRSFSEQRFRSLFVHHPDAVFELNLKGELQSANYATQKIAGFAEENIVGRHYEEFIPTKHKSLAASAFASACRGEPQHYEIIALHRSGKEYWLEITNLPITVNGKVNGVFGIGRDITERKMQEARMRLLERGVESSQNGIVMVDALDPEQPIVYVNPAFCQLTGYQADEVIGHNCRFLQGPDTDRDSINAVRRAINEHREIQVTLRNYKKDGQPFWNQLQVGPVFDEEGCCTHFIGIQQDITVQRQQEDQLASQLTHDSLTGLANRQTFELRLAKEWQLANEAQLPLMVLYIDIDGFRPINDNLGHNVGDKLLISVAQRLRRHCASSDVISRLAGDEFAVMLCNSRQIEDATRVADELLRALSFPFDIDEHHIHISVSIGIASLTNQTDAQALLQHADLAMYEAKKLGRNTWHWYDGEHFNSAPNYIELRNDIQTALAKQQFSLHYQPLIGARSSKTVGFEALIRWHHPTKGNISPADFIPLAEQTGQIVAIGDWVLRRACVDIAEYNKRHKSSLMVAVNISPLQFRRPKFVENIKHVLNDTQLPADFLELEVTENLLILGAERSVDVLNHVRKLGVSVAIDDFGTGYSSLSYLRQLPVDKIKLDRSFIQGVPTNRTDSQMVKGLIGMAHDLTLNVVAEGVETEQQRKFLVENGCDILQGYLLSHPLPLADL